MRSNISDECSNPMDKRSNPMDEQNNLLTGLPDDILYKICCHFKPKIIIKFRLISKFFNKYIKSTIWYPSFYCGNGIFELDNYRYGTFAIDKRPLSHSLTIEHRDQLRYFVTNYNFHNYRLIRDKYIDDDVLSIKQPLNLSIICCSTLIGVNGFPNFEFLHTLNIGYCSNIVDTALIYMKHIKYLNINNCLHITDLGIKHLTTLVHLRMNCCNNITNEGLKQLIKLRELSMTQWPNFTNTTFEPLCNLQCIDLNGCRGLTDVHLSFQFSQITNIDMSHTRITPDSLKKLTNLRKLRYERCRCDMSDVLIILTQLNSLFLPYYENNSILDLSNFTNLTCLCLRNSSGISSSSFNTFYNLKKLNVNSCKRITNNDMNHLTNLTCINVVDTLISNLGIIKLTNLTKLILGDRITDNGINSLFNLRRLYLYSAHQIEGYSLIQLTKLERLTINGSDVTDDYIIKLLQSKTFRTLIIYNNHNKITDAIKTNENNPFNKKIIFY